MSILAQRLSAVKPSPTIAITTKAEGEDEVTFTLGVTVRKFTKESNIATWLIVVPIFLAVGAALFLPPALRRRRKG